MAYDIVTAADAQSVGIGYPSATSEQVANLNKALTTGSGEVTQGLGTGGDGSKLRLQSLDMTLKEMSYQAKHLQMWKAIPKKKAESVSEGYTRFNNYGSYGDGFIGETETPGAFDQSYDREYAQVKYLGVKKELSIASTLVKNQVANMKVEQSRLGTMEILLNAETSLFYGNSYTNAKAWDGIPAQIENWVTGGIGGTAHSDDSDLVYDLRGAPLTEEALQEAGKRIQTKLGTLDTIFMNPDTQSDLAKTMYPKERISLPAPTNGIAGSPISGFASTTGIINFVPDVLIKPYNMAHKLKAVSDLNAAAAPSGVTVTASNNVSSYLPLGTTYYYFVSSLVNGRESTYVQPSPASVTLDPSTCQQVLISVTAAQLSDATAESIRVYRGTASDGSDACWIGDVKRGYRKTAAGWTSPGTTGYTEYVDTYQIMPGCSEAFGIENDPEQVWSFHQLAPLMSVDLAMVGPSMPFMVLLFGVPIMYNPRRGIIFRNIGKQGL